MVQSIKLARVQVNVLFVNNVALTVGGIVTMLTPLFPSYNMLMVYACIFGLAIGK